MKGLHQKYHVHGHETSFLFYITPITYQFYKDAKWLFNFEIEKKRELGPF